MKRRTRPVRAGLRLAGVALLLAVAAACSEGAPPPRAGGAAPAAAGFGSASQSPGPDGTKAGPARPRMWVDPASAGRPYGRTKGMLTFRGNPTRTWYGQGPVPRAPRVLWRFPATGGLCSRSTAEGETKLWCGTGWTGQPNLWERDDGATWLLFGAYDSAYHFLDAATGRRVLPDLRTGDINKGSATLDPDGFPLYYAGSRDNHLRVVALDRDEPTVLWKLAHNAVSPTQWNSDWDGAPLVVGDHLFVGGENSVFHIVRLNRRYGPDGKVTVRPKLVFHAPGWDQELLAALGDREVSIENSVAISGNTVYFANSGGLVQGWDISRLRRGGRPRRVFRFWTGDDTDASVVVDAEGFLYVASEYERGTARSRQVGQLMKLDPRKRADPLVWSVPDVDDRHAGSSGFWSTPALVGDVLVATTNAGRVIGVDRGDGRILWTLRLAPPVWQSPVVVDGVLVQGDCDGVLHGFDLSDPRVRPTERWSVELGGCIEATPTVWKGRIYVGTRSGGFYAVGDPP
jgi:outer membrane protein assembly factor BamB